MNGGKYAKSLAKIQRFVWRHRHAGAYPDGHQHGGRKATETSVTEFSYKNLNFFCEEFIEIKVILFSNA